MDSTESTKVLFLIIGCSLIIISHIALVFLVGRLYNNMVGSLLKVDMCGIREIESDTVRYNVMKALQQYEKSSKWVYPLLITSLTVSIIFVGIIIYNLLETQSEYFKSSSFSDSFRGIVIIILLLIILLLPIIDMVFLKEIPKKIKDTNEEYKKAKDDIIKIIKIITTKYKSFQIENSKDPDNVKQLYKLLLERWSSRNEDGTIEDAKNALTMLSNRGDYEEIFTYLKLDSSLEDQELLRKICKKDIGTCSGIDNALGTLQIYRPQKKYEDFKKYVENRLIILIIMLFIYLSPLFHIFYHMFGAVSFGISIIAVIFFVIAFNYMRL